MTETKKPLECELAYSEAIRLECAAVDECNESWCDLDAGSCEVLPRVVEPER